MAPAAAKKPYQSLPPETPRIQIPGCAHESASRQPRPQVVAKRRWAWDPEALFCSGTLPTTLFLLVGKRGAEVWTRLLVRTIESRPLFFGSTCQNAPSERMLTKAIKLYQKI